MLSKKLLSMFNRSSRYREVELKFSQWSVNDFLVQAKLKPDPSGDGPTWESKPCGNKRVFQEGSRIIPEASSSKKVSC